MLLEKNAFDSIAFFSQCIGTNVLGERKSLKNRILEKRKKMKKYIREFIES